MNPKATEPYIRYLDVVVRYSDYVVGLKGVSLDVQRGEFVFLTGISGSGKSTMLKLLSREVRETSGRITFDGRDLSKVTDRDIPYLRRKMGIVPQDFGLLQQKRVWENISYAMRAVGATKREVRTRVPQILDRVNLGQRGDAFPHELSGGEQQRVAIARALINSPTLLLADEPTGNLDPDHSWEIVELLLQLNLKGTTVLVASHDMAIVERCRQRVVELSAGQIVSDSASPGPVHEVENPASVANPEGGMESQPSFGRRDVPPEELLAGESDPPGLESEVERA